MSQLALIDGPEPTARYLARYRCEQCETIDTSGTVGPRMLFGEPGAYSCASSCWFCRECSAELWGRYLSPVDPRLEARRRRLERYRRRQLPWQKPAPPWWPDGLPLRAREAA